MSLGVAYETIVFSMREWNWLRVTCAVASVAVTTGHFIIVSRDFICDFVEIADPKFPCPAIPVRFERFSSWKLNRVMALNNWTDCDIISSQPHSFKLILPNIH